MLYFNLFLPVYHPPKANPKKDAGCSKTYLFDADSVYTEVSSGTSLSKFPEALSG